MTFVIDYRSLPSGIGQLTVGDQVINIMPRGPGYGSNARSGVLDLIIDADEEESDRQTDILERLLPALGVTHVRDSEHTGTVTVSEWIRWCRDPLTR